MSEQHSIDVKKVIEASTKVKTIQELEKEGRRAVKVVRASRISELISQAVDNVIQQRSVEVVEAERNQLISATGEEFRRLLADADTQRKRSEEDRAKITDVERKNLELVHKLELAEHVHGEDVRLLEEQRRVVDEMKEKVAELKKELEQLIRRHEGDSEEHDQLRAEVKTLRTEALSLRDKLHASEEARQKAEAAMHEHHAAPAKPSHTDEEIKDLVGEVRAIRASFERGTHAASDSAEEKKEMMSQLESVIHSSMDQIVQQMAGQFQGGSGGGGPIGAQPVEAAKIVLDNIFKDTGKSIESNLENISVQSSEGTGIGANLARLKKLHSKGLGDGKSESAGGSDSEVSKRRK